MYLPKTERLGRKKDGGDTLMVDVPWQGILFGILLIIVGLAIAAAHSEPVWLLPGIGISFIGGGALCFVMVLRN